uniref:7TM_GPCR_Srx domain-containing protein n=1 Tax=Caenorhabditis japonica TaxID=281687 RepID=A0A8R1HJ00_CAEJA
MYYEDEIWMFWIDETDPTCVTWSWILDYAKNLSCAVFNCSLDVVTIVKLQYTRRRIKSFQRSQTIRKREIDFVKQTFVQGITALVANGVYYLASGLSQNMYITFMLTTFLWGSFTVTDGLKVGISTGSRD